jgi:hypothetical protein
VVEGSVWGRRAIDGCVGGRGWACRRQTDWLTDGCVGGWNAGWAVSQRQTDGWMDGQTQAVYEWASWVVVGSGAGLVGCVWVGGTGLMWWLVGRVGHRIDARMHTARAAMTGKSAGRRGGGTVRRQPRIDSQVGCACARQGAAGGAGARGADGQTVAGRQPRPGAGRCRPAGVCPSVVRTCSQPRLHAPGRRRRRNALCGSPASRHLDGVQPASRRH